jgi:hypothetical protein
MLVKTLGQPSESVKHLSKQGETEGMGPVPEEVADWALAPRAARAARTTTRVEIMMIGES